MTNVLSHTPFRSPCIIAWLCIYINPLAASLSCEGVIIRYAAPNKLETIRIPMDSDELVDVPILHPFRCHCEVGTIHQYSQQWQHVWMAEELPSYNLDRVVLPLPGLPWGSAPRSNAWCSI